MSIRNRRIERRIRRAELELRDAEFAIDRWGFADWPSERAEKERRVERAQERLLTLLAKRAHVAATDADGVGRDG